MPLQFVPGVGTVTLQVGGGGRYGRPMTKKDTGQIRLPGIRRVPLSNAIPGDRKTVDVMSEEASLRTRLLVIGSKVQAEGVESYAWHEDMPNWADYDAVIVNLGSCESDESTYLAHRKAEIVSLVESRGTCMVISPAQARNWLVGENVEDAYSLLPVPLRFELQSGETIENVREGFQRYYTHVNTWDWCVRLHIQPEVADASRWHPELSDDELPAEFRYEYKSIAQNRYGSAIGVVVSWSTLRRIRKVGGGIHDEWVVQARWDAGRVFVLPPPTEVSVEDGIRILLEDYFEIALETSAPAWVDSIVMPTEKKLRAEVEHLTTQIRKAEEQLRVSEHHIVELREPVAMFYETGSALEIGVRSILSDLLKDAGGQLEEPTVKSGPDGWLDLEGKRAVLEVKGREGTIPDRDVGQLVSYLADEPEGTKGLLVGNAFRLMSLDKRPEEFDGNGVTRATNQDICTLSTKRLFSAYCRYRRGEYSAEEILQVLFATAGEITLDDNPMFDFEAVQADIACEGGGSA